MVHATGPDKNPTPLDRTGGCPGRGPSRGDLPMTTETGADAWDAFIREMAGAHIAEDDVDGNGPVQESLL